MNTRARWQAWRRSWDLNAVLVKEVRQAVRSNLFLGVMAALLTALTGGTMIYLVTVSERLADPAAEAGAPYLAMIGVMLGGALALASLALLARSHQGRAAGSDDLLLITTLTPGAIVRGRILSGLCAVAIILSTGLPFLTVAYLLRGVALPNILWTVLGLVVLGVLSTVWAVLAAACSGPDSTRLTLLVFASPALLVPMLLSGLRYGRGGGLLTSFGSSGSKGGGTIGPLLFIGLVLVTAVVCSYAVSVFMLSPRSLNRARPCRLFLSALFLGWWGLSPVLVAAFHDDDWAEPALVAMAVLIVVGLVTGLFAGDPLSRRVRQEIPRSRLARLWALFFYNGTLPVVLWVTLALGLLLAWNHLPYLLLTSGVPTFVPAPALLMGSAYLLLYVLLARWLGSQVSRYPQFRRGETIFALLAVPMAAGTLLPWLVGALTLGLQDADPEKIPLLGSLLAAFYEVQYTSFWRPHALFLIGMAAVLVVLNGGWLVRALADFSPPAAVRPAPPPGPTASTAPDQPSEVPP
jgi:hypothetical protein